MFLTTPFPDFLCGFPKSLSHPVKKLLILENEYKKA